MSTSESPYRKAERELGNNPDAFWEHLEEHKYDHWTLAVGWALKYAERNHHLDQSAVADRTVTHDSAGRPVDAAISKSYISAMLSGRSHPPAETYKRLARACGVNPIEFQLAEGWLDHADIAAFNLPEQELVRPILQRLFDTPPQYRPRARALVTSMLDSIQDVVSFQAEQAQADGQR